MKEKKHKNEDPSGLLIPAGLFLGLGVGAFLGEWDGGVLFGLGAGFLAMAIVRLMRKK